MELGDFVNVFLIITFVLHGVAFAILAVRRRKAAYVVLTGTFVFLTALYLVKFEGWDMPLPGARWPLTWALRAGATLCTAAYLCLIYREPGSWLRKLLDRKEGRDSQAEPRPPSGPDTGESGG